MAAAFPRGFPSFCDGTTVEVGTPATNIIKHQLSPVRVHVPVNIRVHMRRRPLVASTNRGRVHAYGKSREVTKS